MATLEQVCGLRGIGSRGQVTRTSVTAIPNHRTILGLMWWTTNDTSLPAAGRGSPTASDFRIRAPLIGALPFQPQLHVRITFVTGFGLPTG